MARTVFILGAGASVALGAPTMKTFLRAIRDLNNTNDIAEYQEEFSLVLNGYQSLQPAYAKMKMNYEDDIEELFATFETARILGDKSIGGIEPERLSKAMKRVITATIENKMKFSLGSRNGETFIIPHRQFTDFIRLLSSLNIRKAVDSSIALLTFNYDVALDQALEHFQVPFSYCLEAPPEAGHIPLLKLHGSLNWGVCRKCKKLIPVTVADYWKSIDHPPIGEASISTSHYLKRLEHCEMPLEEEPFIVPPTWSKTEFHSVVSGVWKHAANELSEATNIFVIGYSAPPRDQFFKHLPAISLSRGSIIDTFGIANPDAQVYERFKALVSFQLQSALKSLTNQFDGVSLQIAGQLGLTLRDSEPNWIVD